LTLRLANRISSSIFLYPFISFSRIRPISSVVRYQGYPHDTSLFIIRKFWEPWFVYEFCSGLYFGLAMYRIEDLGYLVSETWLSLLFWDYLDWVMGGWQRVWWWREGCMSLLMNVKKQILSWVFVYALGRLSPLPFVCFFLPRDIPTVLLWIERVNCSLALGSFLSFVVSAPFIHAN
jgi:hypothetical protein